VGIFAVCRTKTSARIKLELRLAGIRSGFRFDDPEEFSSTNVNSGSLKKKVLKIILTYITSE
jgi:hypothetical protein